MKAFSYSEKFSYTKKFCFGSVYKSKKKFSSRKINKTRKNRLPARNFENYFTILHKIKKAQFLEPSSIFCKFENVPKKN